MAELQRGSRQLATRIARTASLAGMDPSRLARSVRGVRAFRRDRRAFFDQINRQPCDPSGPITTLPVLADRYKPAGETAGHYFRQDLHVATLVREHGPNRHVDVGSRLDGFVAHLLVFRPVEVVDVRPLASDVPGLTFVQADATTMSTFEDASLPSLSCLHAIEHFGLGRYGDPVDAMAHRHAAEAFQRVLAPGGRLYVSMPVGRRRVEFNAHRVMDPADPLEMFADLDLQRFDGIDDSGRFLPDVEPSTLREEEYALGIYLFLKGASDQDHVRARPHR